MCVVRLAAVWYDVLLTPVALKDRSGQRSRGAQVRTVTALCYRVTRTYIVACIRVTSIASPALGARHRTISSRRRSTRADIRTRIRVRAATRTSA